VGSPKFSKRTYNRPSHPWQAERIASENDLSRKYGLKNKKEIWKAETLLRNFRRNTRLLLARSRIGDEQAQKEAQQLISRLTRMGVVPEETTLDGILALDVNVILGRRLQTIVYLKGLANTPKQARQFIIHGHIAIKGRIITVPGYLVLRSEENLITYASNSPLDDELHPMRPSAEEDVIVPEGQFEHDRRESDERDRQRGARAPPGEEEKPGKNEREKEGDGKEAGNGKKEGTDGESDIADNTGKDEG